MIKQVIKPAGGAPAVGPYSPAVRLGNLLFCSGQIPIVPETGALADGGVAGQTARVLENIKILLADQKLNFTNVVKTTVFMTDLSQFAQMNEVYAQYFKGDHPARSTVQVVALPKGALVEIEVVAHCPE